MKVGSWYSKQGPVIGQHTTNVFKSKHLISKGMSVQPVTICMLEKCNIRLDFHVTERKKTFANVWGNYL